MGCNEFGCRPYREYDYHRRRDRGINCGPPYGPPCHRRRFDRDDFRNYPSRGFYSDFPRFY